MASRATKKPSALFWLLAIVLGLVAVSLFTGTALWLGASDEEAVFSVEAIVPGIVRIDDTVRPAGKGNHGQMREDSYEKSAEPGKKFETTTPSPNGWTPEPSTSVSPPPDVTSSPASIPTEFQQPGIQEDLLEQRQDTMPSYDQNPLPITDEIEIQPQGYKIPSEEFISLTKRGGDFQSSQSVSEDDHNESFQRMNFQPVKYSEFDYDPDFKGMEAPGAPEMLDSPVRRFDKNPPSQSGHSNQPDAYDGESADAARNPMLAFLQRKLQELHDWISSDEDMAGAHNGTRLVAEFKDVLVALNGSIEARDARPLLGKLKQLYRGSSQAGVAVPAVIGNTSSLVSFGLLAFDLLLLHNVQHVAWEEERLREAEMLSDPEVLALNALFMPADKVRGLLEPRQRSGDAEPEKERTVGEELMEFASGAVRGVINLGRAYRHSAEAARSQSSGTPLDCIWTLYCRNLDKTSRLRGPYGFLAKMNSFGLRLVMGEFPVDNILESVVREFTLGWSRINCQKLFPRCSVKDATSVVLKSVLHDGKTV